jgi:hypothetical protein
VVNQRLVHLGNQVALVNVIEGGVDVQPPEHIVADDRGFVVVFVQTLHLKNKKGLSYSGFPNNLALIGSAHSHVAMSANMQKM